MKRPKLNQEERQLIIHDTFTGAYLNLWLKLQIFIRSLNLYELWIFKFTYDEILIILLKFKNWN